MRGDDVFWSFILFFIFYFYPLSFSFTLFCLLLLFYSSFFRLANAVDQSAELFLEIGQTLVWRGPVLDFV